MHISSKWEKTNAILINKEIQPFIPVTRKWSEANLQSLLSKYRMVYVKPDRGTFGQGVIKAEWDPDSAGPPYRCQSGTVVRSFESFVEMYLSMAEEIGEKPYLVQKGIDLLSLRGRKFDIRVMIQRTPSRRWEATGIIGRLGHPQKIVTNYHNGGRPMDVNILLGTYLSDHDRKHYIAQLKHLGRRISEQCHSLYPGLKEIGVDLGIDMELKPWILEINTRPDPYIFKALDNPFVYKRVIRYHRYHRRRKKRL